MFWLFLSERSDRLDCQFSDKDAGSLSRKNTSLSWNRVAGTWTNLSKTTIQIIFTTFGEKYFEKGRVPFFARQNRPRPISWLPRTIPTRSSHSTRRFVWSQSAPRTPCPRTRGSIGPLYKNSAFEIETHKMNWKAKLEFPTKTKLTYIH